MSPRFLKKKGVILKELSYGVNYPNHAEHDAIENLNKKRRIERKKRKSCTVVNMLVIRYNKTNKLVNSKPCVHCIHKMINIPIKHGYKIKYVYYSDTDRIIVKKKLTDLLKDPNMHMTKRYRNLGYTNPLREIHPNCPKMEIRRSRYVDWN